jgi:hypothetical protein
MLKISADRDPVSLYIFLYTCVNTLENKIIFNMSCFFCHRIVFKKNLFVKTINK